MALKSTIFKADVDLSDLNRNYYTRASLTLARHPSETDERMMLRILAWALHAGEHLEFCKGLSNEDEAALWEKDLTGLVETWIEVGTPDEKRLRKACNKSKEVYVYAYGGRAASIWWEQNRAALAHNDNLTVRMIPAEQSEALALLSQRTMQLQITVQDSIAFVSSEQKMLQIEWSTLLDHQRHDG